MATTMEFTRFRFISETILDALEVIQRLNEGHYISDLCVHEVNDFWAVNVVTNARRDCLEDAMAFSYDTLMQQTLCQADSSPRVLDA
jgi:hypothetical protein